MIIAVYLVLLALLLVVSRLVEIKVWKYWLLNVTTLVAIPVGIWQPLSMPAFILIIGYLNGPKFWREFATEVVSSIKERSQMTRVRIAADVVILVPPDATSVEVEHKMNAVTFTIHSGDRVLDYGRKESKATTQGRKETITWKS